MGSPILRKSCSSAPGVRDPAARSFASTTFTRARVYWPPLRFHEQRRDDVAPRRSLAVLDEHLPLAGRPPVADADVFQELFFRAEDIGAAQTHGAQKHLVEEDNPAFSVDDEEAVRELFDDLQYDFGH